jgi:hypothetical protein
MKTKKRQWDSEATIRRKVERRALPPEPPAHLASAWQAVTLRAMAGQNVKRDVQKLRQAEKAYLKGARP